MNFLVSLFELVHKNDTPLASILGQEVVEPRALLKSLVGWSWAEHIGLELHNCAINLLYVQ